MIFLLGLVTQALFLTTPVSLGTVVALCFWHKAAQLLLGEPLSGAPVAIQVFLGLTFLVTDPATSPRSSLGKFLFGLAYGTGVFFTYVVLRLTREPAYFDKLLVVPIVNLLVPLIDRASDRIERRLWPAIEKSPDFLTRFGWLGTYFVLFVLLVEQSLKVPRTQRLTLLPPAELPLSSSLKQLLGRHIECRFRFPQAFKPFGLRYEFAHLREIRSVYHGPESESF
ncbi:MAG: RnfABCDGE type electron transport complex subunit D [Planctomycetia bacterium]|nr:RnfABCDGE type electron transport complex subunit D [Planctomycetia bacterium]